MYVDGSHDTPGVLPGILFSQVGFGDGQRYRSARGGVCVCGGGGGGGGGGGAVPPAHWQVPQVTASLAT